MTKTTAMGLPIRVGFLGLLLVHASLLIAGPTTNPAIVDRLRNHLTPHPRLLLTDTNLAELQHQIAGDPRLAALQKRFLAEADLVIKLPPLERKLTGKRLLSVSRDAQSRIATLALAYRLTRDPKYADAARQNLLTLCAFSDFHPEHFLDTAEIAAGIGIGYDWLFEQLSADDRQTIRKASIDKALNLPMEHQSWVRGNNNWNQVCNGGLTLGALAIADENPDLAAAVVSQAVQGVPFAMHSYAPDGVYPEGPGYWDYGTTFNSLLIASLQSALGDDFGLSRQPGYLKSAEFHLHSLGPSGFLFDYSDSPVRQNAPAPVAFFLAKLQNDPSLLFYESRFFDTLVTRPPATAPNMDWLLMIWAPAAAKATPPTTQRFVAAGPNPIAVFRSSWQDDATYLAVKAGSPSNNHGHMDVGEFVLDSDGLRWAADLGSQSYESLESRGVDLWNVSQNSQRWQVFRIGPMSHNILTVDGQNQVTSGHATIVRSGQNFAVMDLAPVYAGQLIAARRGAMLRADRSVRIEDEITNADQSATVRFALMTSAQAEVEDHAVMLTQKKKQMLMRVVSPAGARLKAIPADPPPHDYDVKNPGMSVVSISVELAAGATTSIVVDFVPVTGAATQPSAEIVPLDRW